jgi:ribosomal-protein-alanine N-acetyltransferase
MTTLRTFSFLDFPQLLEIEKLTQFAPWTLEVFLRCQEAGYEGWVIEQDSTILGFIVTSLHVGENHILNLCVHPDFQRQGIGRQLVEYVLTRAQNNQADISFLEVRRSNVPAISLYEKLGFIQIGERKGYYPSVHGREDALVFAKDLRVK